MSLSQEWVWVAVIVAIPLVIFGAFELMGWMRRRRYEAVARRSKPTRRQSDSGVRPGRGA